MPVLRTVSFTGTDNQKSVANENQKAEQQQPATKVDTSSLEKAIRESIKEASEKPNANANAKAEIDRKLAEYTGQLAVYTKDLSKYTSDVSNFTFWLVIATAILGVIGIAQGYLTWRTVTVSESALVDLERPYVFVDFSGPVFTEATIAAPNAVGGHTYTIPRDIVSVRYSLYNSGRTAAILTQIRHKIVQTGSDETLPQITDPSVHDLDDEVFPDGTAIDKTRQFAIDFDNRTAPPGLNGAFLIGFVRYRDIFRKRHITGFCARLDRRTNRFTLHGDKRYNYIKDE